MLYRRDKIILSLLMALFVVLTLEGCPPLLDWWCVVFPAQSPVSAAAGEEIVYGCKVLEVLEALLP